MNMPRFTAEASLYHTNNHYQSTSEHFSGAGNTIEAALMKQGVTCSGSCPAGQLLCQCDSHCACCIGGCRCTLNGDVLCDKNPPAARGGFTGFPGGSVLA